MGVSVSLPSGAPSRLQARAENCCWVSWLDEGSRTGLPSPYLEDSGHIDEGCEVAQGDAGRLLWEQGGHGDDERRSRRAPAAWKESVEGVPKGSASASDVPGGFAASCGKAL